MGILSTATLRSNFVAGCPRMSDKDLKATGRGSFDYCININSFLHVVKWYDNKGVIPGSSFSLVKASSAKRRWDSKKKDHCNVAYPDMVKEYNESMDNLDPNYILISLYRVDIRTRKRWFLKISPISSRFVMSTVGYSMEDIVNNCECQKRINTICYNL